jgi:DNA invertase Pin-like site-specific DNA recombinase
MTERSGGTLTRVDGYVSKVRPTHLSRKGIVYVRQSSVAQVQGNLESQRRQYGLRDRLGGWGWAPDLIEVIDEDQGRSGSQSEGRTGFQRLLAEVALGKVGIVIGLETSRLARNNEDWQHLLNICAVVDTLIADGEGVYDLRIHNDRILLGLKGNMSEYELHILQQRLNAGVENKARRHELWHRVPVGYRLTEEGEVEITPDAAVRGAIQRVFEMFRRLGSAHAVAVALEEEGAQLPRMRDAFGRKDVAWRPPTQSFVQGLLSHPVYAGAYAWGIRRTETLVTPDGKIRKVLRKAKRPPEEWRSFQRDHHPGYISWEEFIENQHRLLANRRKWGSPGPVGGGRALLAGLLRCGFCGRTLRTNYSGGRPDLPHYACNRRTPVGDHLSCQSFGGHRLEASVEEMVLSVLEPGALDAALLAERDLERERARQVREWDLEVERATEAEARARRKFEEVEPGHRLVARELERRWEEALKIREETCRKRELRLANLAAPLTEKERRELRHAVSHVGRLWRSRAMSPSSRKEVVRLLVGQVEVKADRKAGRLDYTVHWTTGQRAPGHVPLRQRGEGVNRVKDPDLEILRKMAPTYTDREIAMVLGKMGRRAPGGVPWIARRVGMVRENQGWGAPGKKNDDTMTLESAARLLHRSTNAVKTLVKRGRLVGAQPYPHAPWRFSRRDVNRLARSSSPAKRGASMRLEVAR